MRWQKDGKITENATDTIVLDTTAPTGSAVSINNGDARTNSTSATLNITCGSDAAGPIEVAYGTTSSPTNWETCTSSKNITLSA
jgi:hypothetical protein